MTLETCCSRLQNTSKSPRYSRRCSSLPTTRSTEEAAHDLLMKAEELVPTRRVEVVDKTAELGEASHQG
jgi:hypothetical protein